MQKCSVNQGFIGLKGLLDQDHGITGLLNFLAYNMKSDIKGACRRTCLPTGR